MKKGIITVIILVVLAGIGYGAYKEFSSKESISNTTSKVATTQVGAVQNSNNTAKATKENSTTKNLASTSPNNNTATTTDKSSTSPSNDTNKANTNESNTNNTQKEAGPKDNAATTDNNKTTQNGNPLVYGDAIPGTNQISHNVIQIQGTIYPKSVQPFEKLVSQITTPITEGKVTVSANTPYVNYSGYSSLYKYYIIKPYSLTNGGYNTSETLNQNTPGQTVFNGHENNLTAIGYMQGGVIVAVNTSGNTVYVSANSLKNNITFERGNLQYFCANATVIDSEVQVRAEPAELPTSNTIGNKITQKGLNVVADASVNGFTRIIFGTSHGIFQGWVPSTSIKIENYS